MNSLDETISAITFVYAWYSANEQLPESICDLDEDLSEFSRVSTNMYRKFKTKAWAYVRNVIIDQEYMHRVSKKMKHQTRGGNSVNSQPIFNIFSPSDPSDSPVNLQQSIY